MSHQRLLARQLLQERDGETAGQHNRTVRLKQTGGLVYRFVFASPTSQIHYSYLHPDRTSSSPSVDGRIGAHVCPQTPNAPLSSASCLLFPAYDPSLVPEALVRTKTSPCCCNIIGLLSHLKNQIPAGEFIVENRKKLGGEPGIKSLITALVSANYS